MHLVIPFAAPLSDAGREALRGLRWPRLQALLAGRHGERDEGDDPQAAGHGSNGTGPFAANRSKRC